MDEVGKLLRIARQAAGMSLSQLAQRTNYSKSLLGHLETGVKTVAAHHVEAYEQALGVSIDRLASVAVIPRRVDAASLTDLAVILSATRRLEDSAGARAVLPAVQGFTTLARSLVREAKPAVAPDAAAMASELHQYRGWLELATGDSKTADRQLDTAIALGLQSGHPDRLVHGLSFKAYAALMADAVGEAAGLVDAALRVRGVHPLIRVYDRYQMARVHAHGGEQRQAERALLSADRAAEKASGEAAPDAGYWYSDALWALYRGRILWRLDRPDEAIEQIRAGLAALPREHREAEWAVKWTKAAQSGDGSKL